MKVSSMQYACDQCNFQASQKSNLKTHINSKHEGVKYVCDQCDYQAMQQGNLKKHITSKHKGKRSQRQVWDREA